MQLLNFLKSLVKQYIRTEKTGKVTIVPEHTAKRWKKPGALGKEPVKYRIPEAKYQRTGHVIGESETHVMIQGKRDVSGHAPIHEVPKEHVTPLSKHKAPEKTSRTLTNEEHMRRKEIVEKRLGFSENAIINHPSFTGPAIKITSKLAQENGISTAMGEKTAALWHQAQDADYQEMLFAYALAAMKSWRRILSAPDVTDNIQDFKDVLAGKKISSYTHEVMKKEGESAVIQYLQERRKRLAETHEMDIGDMAEDKNTRQLLENSPPQQMKYTLTINKETFLDDLKKIMSDMQPVERETIRIKFGLGGREPMEANAEVATALNDSGYKDGQNRWTRNTVGKLIQGIYDKIRNSPLKDELGYHYDEQLGRPVWKSMADFMGDVLTKGNMVHVPKDLHPAGFFKANGIEYEVVHEGSEAVVKGGSFDDLLGATYINSLEKSAADMDIPLERNRYGMCFTLDALKKSLAAELQERHPGGRWVPLADKDVYILEGACTF